MKILQVISSFPPAYFYGGALKVAHGISKELVKNNNDVTVYTTDVYDSNSRFHYKTNPKIMEGITVYRFRNLSNIFSQKNLTCAPSMFFFLKNKIREFDIIHLHEYRSFQAVFVHYYAKKNKIPYIVQAHGAILPFFEKEGIKKIFDILWGEKILKDALKLIAVSKVEKTQFLKMGIPASKIEIVPNGIDISEYETLPEWGKFRKTYGIASDEKIILYLGRLHKRKGIDFLINGCSSFFSQYDNIKLIIAGPDNGFGDILVKLVKQLKIEDRVIFTGPISENEKYEVLVDADLLVYPGILEIFGLVPFEAIMCGTPVIVTDDCGCGEIIKEAKCGYLVNYGDIDGLKDRIIQILNDDVQAKNLVISGQEFIRINLNYQKLVMDIQVIYDNLIHGSTHLGLKDGYNVK